MGSLHNTSSPPASVGDEPGQVHATKLGRQMVHLHVTLGATAASAPQLVTALRTLMGAIKLEPGFLACSAWTTDSDDGSVTVHYEERWASELAMEARVRSPRFTKLLEVTEQASAGAHVVFEFVARCEGLDYIAAVRGH